MYKWYENSTVCYVYLADVSAHESFEMQESEFMSRWFTRGWTLQELIAPLNVVFFDKNWTEIGTKTGVQELVSRATSIKVQYLTSDAPLHTVSVGERMSWASSRESTRVEDMAYSLMGVFGVNMPMLCGEGEKAFIRLQHEILRSTNDPTIFAWNSEEALLPTILGPLAAHLRNFQGFRKILDDIWVRPSPEISLTNRGIRITLLLKRTPTTRNEYHALLNCGTSTDEGSRTKFLVLWVQEDQPDEFNHIVYCNNSVFINSPPDKGIRKTDDLP